MHGQTQSYQIALSMSPLDQIGGVVDARGQPAAIFSNHMLVRPSSLPEVCADDAWQDSADTLLPLF